MSFFWNTFASSQDDTPPRPVAQPPRPKQRAPLIQSKPFQEYSSKTLVVTAQPVEEPKSPVVSKDEEPKSPVVSKDDDKPKSLLTSFPSVDDEPQSPKSNPFEPLYIYKNTKPSSLNKYNIRAECTPVHSNYNSPRISVDRLPLFDGSHVLNGGLYKDEKVHGGQFMTASCLGKTTLPRYDDWHTRLVELHHKYSELQEHMLVVTQQLSDLCQEISS